MSNPKKLKRMDPDFINYTSLLKQLELDEQSFEAVKKHIPLYYAARKNDIECLEKFLSSGEFEKETPFAQLILYAGYLKDNTTPLHIAAYSESSDAVQMLINYGMDVNAKDRQRFTPLHHAAESGNCKIVKMLLEAGADCTVAMDTTSYPVNPESPLFYNGFTALHLAAYHNSGIECVKELMKFGADCGARDRLNQTCLHVAAEARNEECVLYMLRNTCCKSFLSEPSPEADYCTPLHFAVMHGLVECVKEMVHQGADVNHRNGIGLSPLHTSCYTETNGMEILKILVLEGRNTDMNSALHPDFFHEFPSKMKAFMVAYGANIDVMSAKTGFTFFEHNLINHLNRDLLKYVTQSMPTLPFLQTLEIFPVIEDMPGKSTVWYSSVLPNNVSFRLVRGEHNMYVEMSSVQNQRDDDSHNFPSQLDTVVNRPLRKLFLLQQPFLDLLYKHVKKKLKDGEDHPDFDSTSPYVSPKRELRLMLQLLRYHKMTSEPRPLKQHCRYSIRKCMGPSNIKHVNKLPLPHSLKSYLLFDILNKSWYF